MKLSIDEGSRLKTLVNIVVLSLALWGVSKRNVDVKETSAFEDIMIDTLAPLQRSVNFIHHNITNFFDHYVSNIDASKENVQMKNKLFEMENKIFELGQLERENVRLKKSKVYLMVHQMFMSLKKVQRLHLLM